MTFLLAQGRPELSLSWIRQEDPFGPSSGAWRVASVRSVLAQLGASLEGRVMIRNLVEEAQPFGYADAGRARFFRVIAQRGLRFYGRALREGAKLTLNRIPDRTEEAIALIEGAADAVGETLPASTGSAVDRSQLVEHARPDGAKRSTGTEARRQAWLCFVKKPHETMVGSINSSAMGAALAERR